jgi:plastocyanin
MTHHNLLPVLIALGVAAIVPLLVLGATLVKPPDFSGEPEELEPVAGGIRYGNGRIPRWLYAAYAIIPLWALFYVASNASVKSEPVPTPVPSAETTAMSAKPSEAPAGGPVKITAKTIAFDKSQMIFAAAGTATIEFKNADQGVPHNIGVYKAKGADLIFKGDIVTGPASKTYTFPAPPAGTYYFQCDVHPSMNGTVVVK